GGDSVATARMVRTPQIFSDASGRRKWVAIIGTIVLLIAGVVCGSAFLFSFLEIPIKAPVAGLFGARAPARKAPELFISTRRAPVSAALLERYRRDALQAIEQLDAAKSGASASSTAGKFVIGFF